MNRNVTKRDGRIVSWDKNRIENAIRCALADISQPADWADLKDYGLNTEQLYIAAVAADNVAKQLETEFYAGRAPNVEMIQDLTEKALVKLDQFDVAKAYILYRASRSRQRAVERKESGIQDYIAMAKYARFDPSRQRREVWPEPVYRVRNMHVDKFTESASTDFAIQIGKAFLAVEQKKVLPSMRSLQFGGEAIRIEEARMFNCAFTFLNRVDAFKELFWLLLCGTGAGFSVQTHHVNKLPKLPERAVEDELPVVHFTVEDTIKGWADAMDALITSYLNGTLVEFSYSNIRAKGMPLKKSGGKAPGHLPLRRALEKVRGVLNKAAGRKLRSIEVYDILMYLAKAVLSGGIRRSATICLFSADDEEMMCAKTGNWTQENPQRSASNNSAVINRKTTPKEVFLSLFEKQKEFGEPGFYFVDNEDYGCNPCFTGDTLVATADGSNAVPIRELAESSAGKKQFLVYSARFNDSRKKWVTEIKKAVAFKTGTKPVIKVTLTNGDTFKCTGDHRLALPDGTYKEAKDCIGVTLEGFYTHMNKYRHINSISNGLSRQYRMIWEFHNGEKPSGYDIDHIDSGLDDSIANLQLLPERDHWKKHSQERLGKNNAVFKIENVEKWKNNLSYKSFGLSNPNSGGLTDLELVAIGKLCLEKYKSLSFDLLKSIDSRFPLSFSKNRFKGSKSLYDKIVKGEAEYESPINSEYISQVTSESLKEDTVVLSIDYLEEQEDVYDLTVEDNHNFFILTRGDEKFNNSRGLLVHNCAEIGLAPYAEITEQSEIDRLRELGYTADLEIGQKVYGWQMCNLTTINAAACKNPDEFYESCRNASLIGTLQAAYTNIPYLGPVTRFINERESLLGVSITGILDNPTLMLDPEVLEKGAQEVKNENQRVAAIIGIPVAARTTCVKPEGTASLLLGTSSGIHPHHSRRYFRRVQANKLEPVYAHFRKYNSTMTEKSIYNVNDEVIVFPVESRADAIIKDDVNALKFLDIVKLVQAHWVQPGRAHEYYNPGLHHNVSNTCVVRDGEWGAVVEYIWDNRDYFTGISLLPHTGDKIYPQAPNEAVTTEADLVRWESLNYTYVDYTLMHEEVDNTALKDVVACAGGSCELF